jgi:hypothetical protein
MRPYGDRNRRVPRRRRCGLDAVSLNPGEVPAVNPFARMGLQSSDRETPTATYAELQAFRAKADITAACRS